MPKLNPSIHEFAHSIDFYRSHGITPSWRLEIKPRQKQGIVRNAWTKLKYSFTSRGRDEERKNKKQLLTLTIPDLPIAEWCPKDGFVPADEIKVIIWATDGYTLVRDPARDKIRNEDQGTPRKAVLRPATREFGDIPTLILPPPMDVPGDRRDSVLAPGNGEGAWWLSPTTSKPKPRFEAPPFNPEEHTECACMWLMAPRLKRIASTSSRA